MAPRKVEWELMLKHELDQAVRDCPVAYLSFGLCEPHGFYNPLGLDGLKAHGLALEAARAGGGVAAPASFWHIHEDNSRSRAFLGRITELPLYLTSIPGPLFFQNFIYQLRACANAGFQAVVAITGHYGGVEYWLKWYAKLFQKHLAPLPVWALADWEVIDHQDYKGSHAGICETAQLLALFPGLPDLKHPGLKEEDPYVGGRLTPVREKVNPELGRAIVASQVRNLARGAEEMLARRPGPSENIFLTMETAIKAWPVIEKEAPAWPGGLDETAAADLFRERVEPYWQKARRSNGRLPGHVFPAAPPESIDGPEW
ncbi:MAG TPA: creatininase family protein [bacterium]|nr:creatininase family protein [bacterium]